MSHPPIPISSRRPRHHQRSIDDFFELVYRDRYQRQNSNDDDFDSDRDFVGCEHAPPSSSRLLHPRRGGWLDLCRNPFHTPAPSSYGMHFPPLLAALCVANSSDATEILMLSYLLADDAFRSDVLRSQYSLLSDDDDRDGGGAARFLAASVFLGMLIGGTFAGFLSDMHGRRPTLLCGLATNAIAGTASSLAPNAGVLTALRFAAGMGIGATVPPLFALATEWSPRSKRGYVVTWVASFWMVGSLFVATVGWVIFEWLDGGRDDGSGGDSDGARTEDDGGEIDNYRHYYFRRLKSGHHDDYSWSDLHGWRIFALACAFPSALGAYLVHRHVPESPRFLASIGGRYAEAADAANCAAAALGSDLCDDDDEDKDSSTCGGVNGGAAMNANAAIVHERRTDASSERWLASRRRIPRLTEEEVRAEFLPAVTATAHAVSSSTALSDPMSPLPHPPSSTPRTTSATIGDSVRHATACLAKLYDRRLARGTTLPLQFVWFALSFSSYGLLTWINALFVEVHLKNIYRNAFLFALANLPGNIASATFVDKCGRRQVLAASMALAAVSLGGFARCAARARRIRDDESSGDDGDDGTAGILFFACAFQACTVCGWNAIDVLTGELFPTRVRSAGLGLCTASGRIGAMVAQFVNSSLLPHPVVLLSVAAGTLLIGAVTPMACLEGRDMANRELSDDIDGGGKEHLSDDGDDLSTEGNGGEVLAVIDSGGGIGRRNIQYVGLENVNVERGYQSSSLGEAETNELLLL